MHLDCKSIGDYHSPIRMNCKILIFKQIHYDVKNLYEIYEKRHEHMAHSGIEIGEEAFAELILTD